MKLTTENVRAVFDKCLWKDKDTATRSVEELREMSTVVEGITATVGFNPKAVAEQKGNIISLLSQLDSGFVKGWSFLQACMNKDGEQWGEHTNMQELMMLGIASGTARYCLPKEMWPSLPGGMPYFAVMLKEVTGEQAK